MSDPYAPHTQVRILLVQEFSDADHVQSSTSPPPGPSSSSDSSSTATATSKNNNTNDNQSQPPTLDSSESNVESPAPTQSTPTNDAIEAAIRAAINSGTSRSNESVANSGKGGGDGRTVPPRDTRTQLFVGNLPYRVRWQDLKDLFRRAGTVLRADVSLGADNRSRGYGTVLLATAEDAGRAIDMFNGYEWQARMLEVRVDRIGGPMSGEGSAMQGMGMQAPMMGGVQLVSTAGMYQQPQGFLSPAPQFPSQSQVQSPAFSLQLQPTGPQQQIFSPQPQTLSVSQLQSHLQVPGQSQFEQLQAQQYQGQQPQQHPPSIPGRTLFVGNLPYHVQWQDLKDLFRRTPGGVTVLRADVALGPDGRSKGFGTVTLRTEEEAERAKRWFSGYEFNGRQLKVHHDRVPVSAAPSHVNSPLSLAASPIPGVSPSLLSQQMMMLNLADALTADQQPISPRPSRRSASPSNTASSSSSRGHAPYISSRLRSDGFAPRSPPSTHTSSTVRSLSSPLLRQIQAYQQDQAQVIHQPSPLQSSTSRPGACHVRSHSGSASGAAEFLAAGRTSSSATSPSSLAVSPVLSTSPSVSRANRPTHIALPAPSFNYDFDPSMASLDALHPPTHPDYDGGMEYGGGERSRRESHGSMGHEELVGMQQTTPLQMHFSQFSQRESRGNEYRREGGREACSPPQPQHEHQLYQLLHGSRQIGVAGGAGVNGKSPKPAHKPYQGNQTSLSQSISSTTSSSMESTESSPPARSEDYPNRPALASSLRDSLSSGASSAANSAKSLPLRLSGNARTQVSPNAPSLQGDTSPGDLDAGGRPQSVVSTTGSTTSESGMSTSFSGSSRTGSSVPGYRMQGSGSPEKSNPHHPGTITLPPPPRVIFPPGGAVHAAAAAAQAQASMRRSSGLSGGNVGKELFQQNHPLAKSGATDVDFEQQSDVSAEQMKRHSTASSDAGSASSRRSGKESAKNQEVHQWSQAQAYHHYQQQQHAYQQQYHHQNAVTPSHHPYSAHGQLTPHGLPPMTPSMPPFTFVGAQVGPGFQSPAGIYPPGLPMSPVTPSHFQQRRARIVSDTRMRHHPNAPGTLSLPPQSLAFAPGAPHQQSPPILSPASTIGPPTGGIPPQLSHSYLLPLGSPGSPYALGPHHPLHHAHQQPFQPPGVYGHVPHPLSHSYGHAAGPLGAMSPGAPWGRPGEAQPYGNAAVGGPIRKASGDRRSDRSRSTSVTREGEQAGEQQTRPYMPSGGYWMYSHPTVVEPKGYFDQLYMSPSGSRDGEGKAEGSGDVRSEGQRTVEREILKDKSNGPSGEPERPPLVGSSSSQSSSTADRTSSMSTGYDSNPDTIATSVAEDEVEMRRFVSDDVLPTAKSSSDVAPAPRLQHSQTDPGVPAVDAAKPSRRAATFDEAV